MGCSHCSWEEADAGWVEVFLLGSGVLPLMARARVSEKGGFFSTCSSRNEEGPLLTLLGAWALDLPFLN